MNKKLSSTTIALGGEPLTVEHIDGQQETLTIPLLKIAQYPQFLQHLDNETELVAWITHKDTTWVDHLTPKSFLDIIEKTLDLNFTQARRWAEHRTILAETLLPMAKRGHKLQTTLETSAPTVPSSSAKP